MGIEDYTKEKVLEIKHGRDLFGKVADLSTERKCIFVIFNRLITDPFGKSGSESEGMIYYFNGKDPKVEAYLSVIEDIPKRISELEDEKIKTHNFYEINIIKNGIEYLREQVV